MRRTSSNPARALAVPALRLINGVARLADAPRHREEFNTTTGLELTNSDIRTVEFLSGQPPVTVSQIAAAQAMDLGQASRQVRRLADTGLVARETDPADRRRTLVTLTDAAHQATDDWLRYWSRHHLTAVSNWSAAELTDLASCLAMHVRCLHDSLPDQPVLAIDERWDELVGRDLSAPHRAAGRSLVALVAWVGQSHGFDDLLDQVGSPLRQPTFLMLHHIVVHGSLAVTEIAAQLGIDPAQASKRVSGLAELGLVDRERCAPDRRRTLVSASTRGRELNATVHRLQLDAYASRLPDMALDQRRRWTALTARYVAATEFFAERNR